MNRAYGGIVVDVDGRILLRQQTGQFDGYAWTFPKGRPEPWETPEEAALREVKEETGYSAEIRRKLPGSFKGGTSMTKFFLMSPVGTPTDFNSQETSAIMWATIDEAAKLIRMTKNRKGLARDLSVLVAVQLALKGQDSSMGRNTNPPSLEPHPDSYTEWRKRQAKESGDGMKSDEDKPI